MPVVAVVVMARRSGNPRSVASHREVPAGASTAGTGRSGADDGDDVDGMTALLPGLAFRPQIPPAVTEKRLRRRDMEAQNDSGRVKQPEEVSLHLPLWRPSMAVGVSSRRSARTRSAAWSSWGGGG